MIISKAGIFHSFFVRTVYATKINTPITEITICAVIPVALSKNSRIPITNKAGVKTRSFFIIHLLLKICFYFLFPSLSRPRNANPTAAKATERIPTHIKTPGTP